MKYLLINTDNQSLRNFESDANIEELVVMFEDSQQLNIEKSNATKPTIESRVREIIADQFDVSIKYLKPKTNIMTDHKLNADSLDCVELVMHIEEEFNLDVPDEAAESLKTVKDIVKYLKENNCE